MESHRCRLVIPNPPVHSTSVVAFPICTDALLPNLQALLVSGPCHASSELAQEDPLHRVSDSQDQAESPSSMPLAPPAGFAKRSARNRVQRVNVWAWSLQQGSLSPAH